ncbi:ankyrin repeat domain-containing protein 31-like isoform X2 [Sparus aurata]|nr:ankyrin repeat domain-containing protein 31-like isoform X2 [Sparus aurata]
MMVLEAGERQLCSETQSCASEMGKDRANVSQRVRIPTKMNLHKRDGKGETLLHKACKRKDLVRIKALIQAGISVNIVDNAGWTALHEASAVGDEAVVEELLQAGANVNARSFDGVTPLHDAAFSGHYQVVKILLQYGSNATDRNFSGLSAADMAEEENIKELLLTFRASCVMHEQPCEAPAQYSQAGQFHAALTRIHYMLIEVLTRQHLENVNLGHKYRGVTDYLRQRLLKSQLVSLAARQRTLVEILQKQMHLLEVYVTKKAQLSRQPSNHPSSTAVTHQRDPFSSPASTPASANASEMHSFYQDSQRKESNRPFTVASLLRSAPTNNIKALEVPRACGPLLTQEENTLKNTDVLNKEASSFQSCALRPRNSSQCINFQMKGYNALIHTRAEDNSRHHSQHIRTGVMPSGRTSQMLLKVTHHEDYVEHCKAGSFQEALPTEPTTLDRIMNVKIIHLVDDEELLPIATLEYYWDKLECEDWGNAFS